MRNMTYLLMGLSVLGIFWAILSAIRWMIFFPDFSNAIFGFSIGLGISFVSLGFAYIYNKLDLISQKQRSNSEKLDSFVQDVKGKIELDEWKNQK